MSARALMNEIRQCTLCREALPLPPRPVLQAEAGARILIAAQAPGKLAHDSGKPFDDPSGDRLRRWLGVDREAFYNPALFALVPMGFCYPGTGKSGDLPPRPECAPQWRAQLLAQLTQVELTLVIGQYAQAWHLPGSDRTLTQRVARWREFWPELVPLPHPSGRNNRWLKINPWFEAEVIPALQARVKALTTGAF
ncbi:uracil-DNA glycosylase family protein [Gilvimarinus algae]|uniref:Uracil-DNA glycosylase family protein n=1 Tax=Gilvimarinus algae TaxID=3058037 RepID=A0ABT8TEN8_9GAMM|nr:uracil-DNA glycosylase family protein [Gilvimarinus sp. SDUM040014]MDO3382090.1 uracil-DNA glycosylase family protein [Gilvimarinus sp. SDUM040014]